MARAVAAGSSGSLVSTCPQQHDVLSFTLEGLRNNDRLKVTAVMPAIMDTTRDKVLRVVIPTAIAHRYGTMSDSDPKLACGVNVIIHMKVSAPNVLTSVCHMDGATNVGAIITMSDDPQQKSVRVDSAEQAGMVILHFGLAESFVCPRVQTPLTAQGLTWC